MTVLSDLQIHRIPLRLSNAYLILAGKNSVLVDAGSPGESNRILTALQNASVRKLDWIFLTHAHFDHVGSAAELRRSTGARILIQEQDVPALMTGKSELGEVRGRGRLSAWLLPIVERILPVEPLEPDITFNKQINIPEMDIENVAIHTPGHTPGSSVLFVNRNHLFAGDLLSTNGTPHPQRYYAQDWDALEQSLRIIRDLNPTVTYPGHGGTALHLDGLLQLIN
jgi:glyoxylase-like metal-dependent hydrolase (beta-lactamase superfamily II)